MIPDGGREGSCHTNAENNVFGWGSGEAVVAIVLDNNTQPWNLRFHCVLRKRFQKGFKNEVKDGRFAQDVIQRGQTWVNK